MIHLNLGIKKNKIYFIFLIFSLLPVLSCTLSNYFSSQVDVNFCGSTTLRGRSGQVCEAPVVFYLPEDQKQTVICRRGLPDNLITPWDFQLQQERGDAPPETGSTPQGEEARSDTITHEIGGYWFKVFPGIRNNSKYYLLVTHINFIIDTGDSKEIRKPFDSSYCEKTPYLYMLDDSGISTGDRSVQSAQFARGSLVNYDQVNRTFVQGNLVFYVDKLPDPSGASSSGDRFSSLRIPNYSVEWQVFGTFHDVNTGTQVGTLKKRGFFTARGSSF